MAKKEPKIRICAKCGARMPASKVIDGKRRILSARKYCLECSPFNQHNTRQLVKPGHKPFREGEHLCPMCLSVKPVKDFYKRGSGLPTSYCKTCTDAKVYDRMLDTKRKAVEYKGGSCRQCGYKTAVEALEFHHRDSKEKEFSLAKIRSSSWERVVKELDKCDLLCSNCHREEHASRLPALMPVLCAAGNVKVCRKCTISQSVDDFYKSRNGGVLRRWCKVCVKNDGRRRKNEAKQKSAAYKGGACLQCGYSKCLAAMDFHHRDPAEKEFEIGGLFSFTDKAKTELDKCDLLCGNCHREEHARLNAKAQLESQAS